MSTCKCKGHYTTKAMRWVVLERGEKSLLYCLDCRWEWKSKAWYVGLLPDHKKRIRSGLTDQDILSMIESGELCVDIHNAIVCGPTGAMLKTEHKTHKEGEQRGTYRFVSICSGGRKKKIALHRLVWMAASKELIPEGHDVDHMGSQTDDTITNLRLLPSRINQNTHHPIHHS